MSVPFGTAAEAVACVQSGDTVGLMHACGEPQTLVEALVARASDLRGVRVLTGWHGTSPAAYAAPELAESFTPLSSIPGPVTRRAIAEGRGEFLHVCFGEMASAIGGGRVRVDVAFLQVSPPDAEGMCSLGVSVDYALAMIDTARTRVAEVNPHMPNIGGAARVSFDVFDVAVRVDRRLLELPVPETTPEFEAIGHAAAALVPNGATIQIGVGALPAAVLNAFHGHADLGLHSGMIGDSVLRLYDTGVLTGRRKSVDPGKLVTGSIIGSRACFAAAAQCEVLEMRPATYTHGADIIAAQSKFVGINSAIEVDLGGNVNAEMIGGRRFSGPGGQPEFAAGALAATDGQSLICLPATAKGGTTSRIVARLADDAVTTTPGKHVTAVVTEYGTANLRGLAPRARADAIARTAHPDFRAALLRAAADA